MRNTQGRYINPLSIIDYARHFYTECSDVEHCFRLDLVKQGLKSSVNDLHVLLVFWVMTNEHSFSAGHPRGPYIDFTIFRKRRA